MDLPLKEKIILYPLKALPSHLDHSFKGTHVILVPRLEGIP